MSKFYTSSDVAAVCKKALASQIADDLFENGNRQKGHRLVLTGPNGENLGGWSRKAAIDRIYRIISESGFNPTPRKRYE